MPPLRLAALTCNLLLGGANTFLLHFLRTLRGRPEQMRVVSFGEVNEHAADFSALQADVRTGPLRRLIYEDRLRWAYHQVEEFRPHALLACLGSESFEMLRLAPAGVARIGLVQADDAQVYAMAARYVPSMDAIVGVSHQIAENLRARPEFRGTRIAEIPYGIAFETPQPRPARKAEEPVRILYLGRLIEEQKRISRVIELVKLLETRGAPVQFTIAGNGPDEAAVGAALAGNPRVRLPGAIANRDVPALLRAHDVFVLLSDYEGLPLSLLEAMGEGVVPVVSDLSSGMGEAVSADCGVRVPVGDVSAAAEAIASLEQNPERLAALSVASAARARRQFSAEQMVSKYLSLIREIAPVADAAWTRRPRIPAPLGLPAWLYSGWPRRVRRLLKRLR